MSSSANIQDSIFSLYKKEHEFTINDVRRADLSDLQAVEKLKTNFTVTLFGDINLAKTLDRCHKSICLQDDGNEVAFLCLDDHPNVPSVPPWEWSHWLYNIYGLDSVTPINSLWIHFIVWEKKFTYAFLPPMMKSLFAEDPFLEYVIMVVPPGILKIDWLEDLATRIVPSGFYKPHKIQTLYLFVKQTFVTKYKIRRAVEEDNDDLIPLIHTHTERIRQHYGEFYVAEILTRHKECDRKLIVAEHGDEAVAVLFLNSVVNIDALSNSFELVPYYGLRKPHEDDSIDNYLLREQFSDVTMYTIGDDVEPDLLPLQLLVRNEATQTTEDGIEITEKRKQEDYISCGRESDESIDDYSFVDVSSAHLLLDFPKQDIISPRRSTSYSAMILSDYEYNMQLYATKSVQSIHDAEEDNCPTSKDALADSRDLVPKPKFFGESNAFALEIAVAKPEHELESLNLLLQAAFECFPDRDYCVLTIPSTCYLGLFSKYFSRVPPRSVSTFPHELYIIHRNSHLGRVTVRIAVKSDITSIKALVSNIVKSDVTISDFVLAVSKAEDAQAYVILSEDQILGVAVIKEELDFEYLRSHYELTHFFDECHHKAGSYGLIKHFILSPILREHACFFLREIHRLSDYSVLYYCVFPSDTSFALRERSLCCVMSDLTCVKPRLKPEFNHTNLDGCMPPDVVHRIDPPFALYVSTSRRCSLPRYEINTKIVVVGSSDTAIGFLESLIYSWSSSYRVTFSNITVVSAHGLSYEKPDNKVRKMLFPVKNNYDHRYLNLISLRTFVNQVPAVMTDIKRKDKLLIVNNDRCISYDLLFLMSGRQFQKPHSIKDKKQKVPTTSFPKNVFLINTDTDARQALSKLKQIIFHSGNSQYTVIVYGCALETFCCMAALVEFGVKPQCLTFVESYPDISEYQTEKHAHAFPDPDVQTALYETMKEEGIKIYQACYFYDWVINKDTKHVTTVKFESHTRRIGIDCIAMFMYNDKTVSAKTFMAISKSGLVFDGGLVIGPDCRTNDPNIYAAGSTTKYSRRFYADHMIHKYYNQEEIGTKLGKQIRKKLIPCFDEETDWNPIYCEPGNMLVPVYEKPLMTYCRLPGDLRYLHVTKPGKPIPLEVAMSGDDYGQVFVTGDCKSQEKEGYFRLHLNPHGVVETITCLAKFDIDRKNLTSLWGKHEKLLNNLQARFEMALITDLFEYFRQPWCCAIYHDRFSSLETSMNKLLTSKMPIDGKSLMDHILTVFYRNKWTKLTDDENEEIEEKFDALPYRALLEQKVFDFLRDNITFLPMYAHPMISRILLQGCENSDLFEKQ